MSYDYQEKKITAVISDTLPMGLALNALGHLAFAAGRYADQSMMGVPKLVDADEVTHAGIAKYPFIVLKASQEEIKTIVHKAREKDVEIVDYTQEMFDTATDEELIEAISKIKEPGIMYHAIVLVGKTVDIKTLTGHLKLYK